MDLRSFGGVDIPVIGQGTWQLERGERAAAIASLQAGLELGLTHLDTAEMYGRGQVEEIVAEAIAGRRERVFLVSKVLPSNASYAGTVRACEASLARLRTDHLDAYLLHWPGPHPLAETVRAFKKLEADGKIRSFGVSNFDEVLLEEAIGLAGRGQIACNQVLYHLGERHAEAGLGALCAREGVALVGYSPFGSGRFPAAQSEGGRVLAQVAQELSATPRQVALAFLSRRAILIPKAATLAHVRDNAAAGELKLTSAQVAAIDAAFPVRRRGELPTL